MRFSKEALCILAALPSFVQPQNPPEPVQGGMNLRGDLLENPIQAEPLGVDVDAEGPDATTTTTTPYAETTTTTTAPLTIEMVELMQQDHCNRWQSEQDYPAAIYCILMDSKRDRRSDLGFEFKEMHIDKLRRYIVKSMPAERKFNEKAYLEALKNQSMLGNLSRYHNVFQVQLKYVEQYAKMMSAEGRFDEDEASAKPSKSSKSIRKRKRM